MGIEKVLERIAKDKGITPEAVREAKVYELLLDYGSGTPQKEDRETRLVNCLNALFGYFMDTNRMSPQKYSLSFDHSSDFGAEVRLERDHSRRRGKVNYIGTYSCPLFSLHRIMDNGLVCTDRVPSNECFVAERYFPVCMIGEML